MRKLYNICDNVHGVIELTYMESMLLRKPVFNRLHHVYQNSTAYLTWPSLRNQRFEHSIGTADYAGKMFFHSIRNADPNVLECFASDMKDAIRDRFSDRLSCGEWALNGLSHTTIKEICRTLLSGGETIWLDGSGRVLTNEPPDPSRCTKACLHGCPLYNVDLVPSNVPSDDRALFFVLAQSVRLAGMLHDVGHPPFSHVLEAALVSIYREILITDTACTAAQRDFVGCINDIIGITTSADGDHVHELRAIERAELHELIGNRLAKLVLRDVVSNMASDATFDEQYLSVSLAVMVASCTLDILSDNQPIAQLHPIVSGVVDADRMDYIQRDSIVSGFGPDALQLERLIVGMRLCEVQIKLDDGVDGSKTAEMYVFAFPIKTTQSVEAFLRKRLENYRIITNHHRVVKSEALMKRVVSELATEELAKDIQPELATEGLAEGVRSDGCLKLPYGISGLWAPFLKLKSGDSDAARVFSQWNDSWFMAVLNEQYLNCPLVPATGCGYDMGAALGELLHAKKAYCSLVKRPVDCLEFRNEVRARLEKDKELAAHVEGLKTLSEPVGETQPNPASGGSNKDKGEEPSSDATTSELQGKRVKGDATARALRRIVSTEGPTNYLREVDKVYRYCAFDRQEYRGNCYGDLLGLFNAMVGNALASNGLAGCDYMVEKSHIKTGVSGKNAQFYFYSDLYSADRPDLNLIKLEEASNVAAALEEEVSAMPLFYTFVRVPPDKERHWDDLSRGIQKKLAEDFAAFLSERIKSLAELIVPSG